MKCFDCDSKTDRLFDDPRVPPLDTEPCLCRDCLRTAAEEMIEECRNTIAELTLTLKARGINVKGLI